MRYIVWRHQSWGHSHDAVGSWNGAPISRSASCLVGGWVFGGRGVLQRKKSGVGASVRVWTKGLNENETGKQGRENGNAFIRRKFCSEAIRNQSEPFELFGRNDP